MKTDKGEKKVFRCLRNVERQMRKKEKDMEMGGEKITITCIILVREKQQKDKTKYSPDDAIADVAEDMKGDV